MGVARVSGRDAVVVYRRGRGVEQWRLKNEVSPVPGVWPYGLDELGAHGLDIRPVEVDEPTGLRRRLPLGLAGGRRVTADTALCWAENVAEAMYRGVSARRYASGVIWATDAVDEGGDAAALTAIRRTLMRMDALWVLSRPQVDKVKAWLGPGCPPVHFLRFGVDPEFYAPQPYPTALHLVSAGGDRDRDPDTLYRAFELVRAERPEVTCTVQTTSRGPAPAGVTVVEHLPHRQMVDLLGSAAVVAIATRPNWHASGITVGMEAMSVGRPVVVCDTPGMDDYFEEGRTAHLVTPGDSASMAARILELLDSPDRARQMGAAGRAAILDWHSTSTMCRDLAAIVAGRAG